jgi:hypothetical protein
MSHNTSSITEEIDMTPTSHSTKAIVDDIEKMATQRVRAKYNPALHIRMLSEVIISGNAVVAFCGRARIGRSTFYRWLDKYPEFAYAYELSLPVGENTLLNEPVTEPVNEPTGSVQKKPMDYRYWRLRMLNQYQYGIPKMHNMECESLSQRLVIARKAFASGEISIAEYEQLLSALHLDGKVTALSASLSKLLGTSVKEIEDMTREELQEKVDAIYKRIKS